MKLIVKSLIAGSFIVSANALAAECILPNPPLIPDGNVASKDELISAQSSYKAFESKIFDYRDCLSNQEAKIPADSETIDAQKAAILELDNISVDSLKGVAEEFNLAVRAFKER